MISPCRAGSSHSSIWRIFSSARLVTFFIQLEEKISARKSQIGHFLPLRFFSLFPLHFYYIFVFLWWMILFLLRITYFCWRKKSLEIKSYISKKYSWVSARKLKCSAGLYSAWKLFSSARLSLGNFSSNSSLLSNKGLLILF